MSLTKGDFVTGTTEYRKYIHVHPAYIVHSHNKFECRTSGNGRVITVIVLIKRVISLVLCHKHTGYAFQTFGGIPFKIHTWTFGLVFTYKPIVQCSYMNLLSGVHVETLGLVFRYKSWVCMAFYINNGSPVHNVWFSVAFTFNLIIAWRFFLSQFKFKASWSFGWNCCVLSYLLKLSFKPQWTHNLSCPQIKPRWFMQGYNRT